MPFYKLTYHERYRRATFYHYGCTFQCRICSYKLRSGAEGRPGLAYPPPERFLSVAEMKSALAKLGAQSVSFMGGEPSIAAELPELLDYAKNTLGLVTALGHTNGNRLDFANLDFANVGFKSWFEESHLRVTGRSREPIYAGFAAASQRGLKLKANLVMIDEVVEADQAEALARWLAQLNPEIPLHLMGYIPVPGVEWRKPAPEKLKAAVAACRRWLKQVESSDLSVDEALGLTRNDDRFASVRIL